jgi:hypothetical protein
MTEMRYATSQFRRAATRLLAHEATREPDTSEALAAASARLFERMSSRLAEVIGAAGVQALFMRAVKLRRADFAFLDEQIVARVQRDGVAESLSACLREQKPEVIREASVILFATFLGLLATVIGDRLTWAILRQFWPDVLLPEGFQEAEGE